MLAVDLFCGVGGLSAGFAEIGWQIGAANDSSTEALKTYRKNFGSTVVFECPVEDLTSRDILSKLGASKGDIDCLVGGPPCQAFSINNHKRSMGDYRASLVGHYLRLVSELKPKSILIENVPGMLSVGEESPISAVKNALESLDYMVSPVLLSGDTLGLPQTRKRLFILACRYFEPNKVWINLFGSDAKSRQVTAETRQVAPNTAQTVSVFEAFSDLPSIPNGGGSRLESYKKGGSLSAFQTRARNSSGSVSGHVCSKLGSINLERLAHIRPGENWRSIPFALLPKGMQRAKKSDHTKRYGRLSWSGVAGTILTKCDPHWGAYFHPDQNRVISVREAARLQGFKDDFEFEDNGLTNQYRGIGNAVPPVIAAKIARAIKSVQSENM